MKNFSVFPRDANPAVDLPKFHTSRADAEARVELGSAFRVGPNAIQLCVQNRVERDQRYMMNGGTMRDAWHIKPSDRIAVWQMRKIRMVCS